MFLGAAHEGDFDTVLLLEPRYDVPRDAVQHLVTGGDAAVYLTGDGDFASSIFPQDTREADSLPQRRDFRQWDPVAVGRPQVQVTDIVWRSVGLSEFHPHDDFFLACAEPPGDDALESRAHLSSHRLRGKAHRAPGRRQLDQDFVLAVRQVVLDGHGPRILHKSASQ